MAEKKSTTFSNALAAHRQQSSDEQRMFVYFDDHGNIKCITPIEDENMSAKFSVTKFPVSSVKRFISGEINPSEYIVKLRKGKIAKYVIIKKASNETYFRGPENYLTEIRHNSDGDYGLKINIYKDKFVFELSDKIKNEILENTNEKYHIAGRQMLYFFITAEKNPDALHRELAVSVEELVNDKVEIEYEVPSRFSIYATKIFDNYCINYKK